MVDLEGEDEGIVSDDDKVEEEGDGPWFSTGMSQAEYRWKRGEYNI